MGEITSTVRSPVLDAQIALARVDVAYSAIDTCAAGGPAGRPPQAAGCDGGGLPLHFDPTKARVRA